ncbi:MAG: heat-inducible transcriptional repressor HrcA [Rothia sp. (in: high G+C Gram-positive bacteria)]|uniref:heat-inducible transcriptional repressor HrcA n=1 Tax=Rothia sp. (in: high G+C Gram-positive bacteria) TaxID=1885016 RepID=UPI002703E9E2|nr:heat-inducible transcriptional repressor HrcA [Rothia sp. (in: high G+C Gram-positive bacteria)]
MNHPRRLQVLQAIVEEYVHTREPVGSKTLLERHQLGVSSATVRNDMAALEEQGLIQAPHASAGRVPTDRGYRLFVDQISALQPLSDAEKRAIHTLLDSAESVDEMMKTSVRLLSSLTQQVAMVQYPAGPSATVRHIELVSLSSTTVLLILITDSGQVTQRSLTLAHTPDELTLARQQLLELYANRPFDRIAAAPASAPGTSLLAPLTEALHLLAAQGASSQVLIAGTSYLAASTVDFRGSIAPVLDALEEQVVLLKLLTDLDHDERGFAVSIGSENRSESLAETSVVASSYGPGGAAHVGVVGPTRMDYASTLSKVNAVARYLSKILGQA